MSGTPQGGVISPLLSNIYLHFLDNVWQRQCAHLGTLVRYADDFVVMCETESACEEAERRVRVILTRLKLELHPEKTRRVELTRGAKASTSSAVICTSGWRTNVGAERQARVLPATVAEHAEHEAGAAAGEGADQP